LVRFSPPHVFFSVISGSSLGPFWCEEPPPTFRSFPHRTWKGDAVLLFLFSFFLVLAKDFPFAALHLFLSFPKFKEFFFLGSYGQQWRSLFRLLEPIGDSSFPSTLFNLYSKFFLVWKPPQGGVTSFFCTTRLGT